MYDGVTVANWPPNVTEGLVYTDGRYANATAARARFPNATFQTISAVGQVPAMWIDCEPGCVWPPAHAVALYQAWKSQGCRGIYANESTKPAVLAAARAVGESPEIFGADYTGLAHINPGEAQTQFQNTVGFDVTAVPDPPTPAPVPVPTPGEDMPLTPDVQAAFAALHADLLHDITLILYGDSQAAAEGKAVQGHPFNLLQMKQELDDIKATLAKLQH